MDRGAWQVIVHRVAKSWTQLKRLSTQENLQMWNMPVMRTDGLYLGGKCLFTIVNSS